jgi:PRTRC genetic system protein F
MQLNSLELQQLENAIPSRTFNAGFQLPTLNNAIPRTAAYTPYQTNFGTLGMQLLAAGVIDPETIPEDAVSPALVVEQGLKAWFAKRIGQFQHMRVDAKLLDAESANDEAESNHWEDISFTGAAIALTGGTTEIRYVKDIALHVEKQVPDLFLTVFTEVMAAGYRTIELQQPCRILDQTAAYSLWDTDIYSVTDEEAAESLAERYGEVDGDYYMPDAMLEAFGNGYCFNITRIGKKSRKVRKFPTLLLKKLRKHQDQTVAAMASGLLNLRDATRRADKLAAHLQRPGNYDAQPLYVGCILLFSGDDREDQFMDDDGRQLWDNGLGSEIHAMEQLPATVADMKTYFQQLDALLDLAGKIDALIPIISYSPYAE